MRHSQDITTANRVILSFNLLHATAFYKKHDIVIQPGHRCFCLADAAAKAILAGENPAQRSTPL
jgi:hypothetical protein